MNARALILAIIVTVFMVGVAAALATTDALWPVSMALTPLWVKFLIAYVSELCAGVVLVSITS